MKCINNELIQRYIDGETAQQKTEWIASHLRTCAECARRVEEQRAFIALLKNRLRPPFESPASFESPPFVMPYRPTRRFTLHLSSANRKYIVYAASVACVLLLLFFVHPKKEKTEEMKLLFLLESDFDANKPVLEQDLMLYLIDTEGNVVNGNGQ